jgi:hypothetical protein
VANGTPPTDQELLDGVNVAINTTLQTGKSVQFNGRSFSPNELPELWELRASLENRLGLAGAGSLTRVAAYCKGV